MSPNFYTPVQESTLKWHLLLLHVLTPGSDEAAGTDETQDVDTTRVYTRVLIGREIRADWWRGEGTVIARLNPFNQGMAASRDIVSVITTSHLNDTFQCHREGRKGRGK